MTVHSGIQRAEERRVRAYFNTAIAMLSWEKGAGGAETTPAVQHITIELRDIRELFSVAEYDPFDPHSPAQSGIESIVDALKPTRLHRKLRVTIRLPKGSSSPDLTDKTLAAIRRYAEARIEASRVELASLRWQGFKALQTGIIFLAMCLGLSAGAAEAEFLSESIRTILSEGFLIAGWVSMWHPTELLLYEWWPLQRQRNIYAHIRDMELDIQA